LKTQPIIIATRGSALALAQTEIVREQCRKRFPHLEFEVKIIKTTGDKLQRASMAQGSVGLPKGLFTKELEVALIKGKADMAIHSLKDLPTDLPANLKLGAVLKRADVRDALIYRQGEFGNNNGGVLKFEDLPSGSVVATTSTRRGVQILAKNHGLVIKPIRGNIVTRLEKISQQKELSAMVLAFAGLERLNFTINSNGRLLGDAVPDGLLSMRLEFDEMLPAAGQGSIGIEIRADDGRIEEICRLLNHYNTFQCVTAERAFLRAMGGGCQSPVAVCAEIEREVLAIRAISFHHTPPKSAKEKGDIRNPVELGEKVAEILK
jgi:hydroxymethylbilane synthase